MGLAAFLLTLELIRYVERSDRELISFLDAIRQNDFSNSYVSPRPWADNERLRLTLQGIMGVLQRLSQEKESSHQYLQTVVEHVSVALICFEANGRVAFLNTAAKQLLGKPTLLDLLSLKAVDPVLYEAVRSLRPGKAALAKYQHHGSQLTLSLHSTRFILKEKPYTLISLRDIRHELEQQEAESWQKLIRVLTHEIMNSVIPITNLSQVVNEMLDEKSGDRESLATFYPEEVADLRGSLQTIEKRSQGLAHFVKAYGKLTHLPPPHFQEVSVSSLFGRISMLLKPGLAIRRITFKCLPHPPPLTLDADPEMMEQVLINLVLNAADAVEGGTKPSIILSAVKAEGGPMQLLVTDNGPGISPEALEQIFVPFYTTKPHGSGIGLSLSRQIMRLHHGSLRVQSEVGKGSSFMMEFL